jgi:flagellar basal-body rod protein FlgG
MSETVQLIESAMRADAERLRSISQNIANAEVPAYRRQLLVTRGAFDNAMAATAPPLLADAPLTQRVDDRRAGTLKATGEPLHLAIEGGGFFALQGANGVLLTRRGDLHVGSDGTLLAATGEPVLGVEGLLQMGTTAPQIDPDGTVRDGAQLLGQLRLVAVADESRLEALGNGTYAVAATSALEEASGLIRQGYLETSNVNPTGEMVDLMETLRHFDTSQKLVHGYDQMLEKAISELGKVG